MQLKADENLAAETIRLLRSSGLDVTTVREEGLAGATDERVADAAADVDSQLRAATRLAALLSNRDPVGEIWVLQEDRLRIRRIDVE